MSFLAPGADVIIQLGREVYAALENIKVYKEQCRDLANTCTQLELAVRDSTEGVESDRALAAAAEVTDVILSIRGKLIRWARLGRIESLIQQGDIKKQIDRSYQDIDICMQRFDVSASMDLSRGTQNIAQLQARDYAELRDELSTIKDNINNILQLHRPEVESVMQTLQMELRNEQDPGSEPSQDIQEGLWKLHKGSSLLPPLPDLTGQVVKESTEPVASGAINDVYHGVWLGEEQVALKFPRAINYAAAAKKQFLKEVDVWRRLQHPNVVRLYGVVYFGERLFTVSTWMDKGSAIEYVKTEPQVNRLKLLEGVVLGMEYLHSQKFVHGDLRGANVLIDRYGRPCLSDFGFSKMLEEVADHLHSASTGMAEGASTRWAAPELIAPDPATRKHVSVSHCTDAWSFGMLCLELMTGERPFHDRLWDIHVAMALLEGKLPERPGQPAISRGLGDGLWEIMMQCWSREPQSRPSMSKVKEMLRALPPTPVPSPGLMGDGPITYSPAQVPPDLPMTPPSSVPETKISPGIMISPSSRRDTTQGQPSAVAISITKSASHLATPPTSKSGRISPSQHGRTGSLGESPTTPRPIPSQMHGRQTSGNALGIVMPPRSSTDGVSPLENFPPRKFSGASSTGRPTLAEAPYRSHPVNIPGRPSTAPAEQESTDSFQTGSLPSFSSSLPPIEERARTGRSPSVAFSMSSTASSTSLLDAACMDPDPYYRLSTDGTVEAGTLEGLISKLFTNRTDHDYRSAFLITYRTFTNSEALLDILIRRFAEAGADDLPTERRALLRYSILDLLRNWFQKRYVEKDMMLLERAQEFCRTVRTTPTLTELAIQISATTDQRIRLLHSPPFPMSPPAQKKTVPNSAYELAIALTMLEGGRFSAILPGECVAYLRRRPETYSVPSASPNSLELALETNKRISNWVKKSILYCDDLEERIARTKFMCNTAAECRTLRNFSSMWAIWSALQSPVLTRLSLTRKGLSASEEQSLRDIDQIMSWTEGRRAYRSLLDTNKPCVPYLGWHLLDFRNVYGKLPATVELEGHVCINFKRCSKLAEAITGVIGRYRTPDLTRACVPGTPAYLESQLKRVGEHTTAEFEARSMELKAEEDADRTSHRRELEVMGFAPRRPKATKTASSPTSATSSGWRR